MRDLAKQYGWHQARRRSLCWREGNVVRTMLSAVRVTHYRLGQERGPRVNIEGEPA